MTILAAIVLSAPSNRAAFARSMANLSEGEPKAKVRQLLGKPDDIWPANDTAAYVMSGDEAWCYGTNGHHTFPTRGYIVFRRDKVLEVFGGHGTPPSEQVVGEAELVAALRKMSRPRTLERVSDPQRLIQVANLLIPKRQAKALAILGEYARVCDDVGFGDQWLYWLVRIMFASRLPGGVFPVPRIGEILPPPPADLRSWPTYPILMVDDLPINLMQGSMLAGEPEAFEPYLRDHQNEWTMRTTPLRPPDDPFPSYAKLVASRLWPLHRDPYSDGHALEEVLRLVSTAYRPKGEPYITGRSYERLHREYLKLGCYWDPSTQAYARDRLHKR